ncbi:MAG: MarC family protein, partial [Dokdonia donghaensis]|nr:MarC family protein [Dokdonia donghaensis]
YSIQEQLITTVLVLIVIGLTCLILLGANRLQQRIGNYGITVISKIMGLILAAYAVQSILSGISHYFSKI